MAVPARARLSSFFQKLIALAGGDKSGTGGLPDAPEASFAGAMKEAGGFPSWLARRRQNPRQITEFCLADADALRAAFPDLVRRTFEDAERVMRHEFDLLGSGAFTPADPDRPAGRDGYVPIDWFLDPVRKLRFRSDVPYKEWSLYTMRPENADIKYPWELARCQHFLTLAQAYVLTAEDRFAQEILRQCADFIEANPVGRGINWTCTMDIALRAANWCLALSLIKNAPSAQGRMLEQAYTHLYDTGVFVLGNLEDKYEVTSNHYLSNVIGLHVLAAEFSDLEIGREWDAYSRKAIEREIFVQTLEDGADFESSVPYHRLVAELFLSSWRLAQLQGKPLSDVFRERLIKMVDFLAGTLRPDGRMPIVGDIDDGRFMIATGYGGWDRRDGRHLLAPAAVALERPEWSAASGPSGVWEAFWWGCPPASANVSAGTQPAVCKLFPAAGLAVSRSTDGGYLLVSNAPVGTVGFGNHKHNDLLSFEYHDAGQPLVVDPGSFVYTCDFPARNLFRSTAYHNTVIAGGVEQNEFNPEWLFRMFAKAVPEHRVFEARESGMRYEGSHDGYVQQLQPGLCHIRRFECDHGAGTLHIEDRFEGEGRHELKWHFHFDPSVKVALHPGRARVLIEAGTRQWEFSWDSRLTADLSEGWFSPSYGVRTPATVLTLALAAGTEYPPAFMFDFRRMATAAG